MYKIHTRVCVVLSDTPNRTKRSTFLRQPGFSRKMALINAHGVAAILHLETCIPRSSTLLVGNRLSRNAYEFICRRDQNFDCHFSSRLIISYHTESRSPSPKNVATAHVAKIHCLSDFLFVMKQGMATTRPRSSSTGSPKRRSQPHSRSVVCNYF